MALFKKPAIINFQLFFQVTLEESDQDILGEKEELEEDCEASEKENAQSHSGM